MANIISKKKKISDIVIDEIRRMVENGELHEGDRFPNQNQLSEDLGVSRPSLREALNQLTVSGVIEQKPGAGTVLKNGNPDLWFSLSKVPVLADTKAALELVEARSEIESIAIKLAIENMTTQDYKKIEESIHKMEASFENKNVRQYLKEDLNFHYLIAKSGHNRYILQMLINIKNLMEEFMRESFEEISELLSDSLKHHHTIYNAICNKDKQEAIDALKNHMKGIDTALRKYYKEKSML
jgi:GntR family transcriptional repressor for pyruvate dehydrogenase complex